MIPGSYHNGFAPRDYEPLYPGLWRGCVGAWCPSLGPSGATLRDWSGYQQDGTLTSMTLATDWVISRGYSLLFNGTSARVVLPESGPLHPTTGVAVFAWIYPTQVQTGFIFDNEGPTPFRGYALLVANISSSLKLIFNVAYNVNAVDLIGNTSISLNNWHHIGAMWDGSIGTLYLDGKPDGSASMSGPLDYTAVANSPAIGSRNTGSTSFFRGYLDDVRLYDRSVNNVVNTLHSGGNGRGISYAMREQNYYRAAGGMLLQRRRACV